MRNQVLANSKRAGGFVMNDTAEPDFIDFIRNPANGFISVTLPLKAGTERAVRLS